MNTIPPSELIINPDGSVFHLHLRPEELADTVILVGDPDRSSMIAGYFDRIESSAANREFRSHTGTIGSTRLTVLSTGIGCDNIDIVMNELDALANVDFTTSTVRPLPERRSLRIVRLGTSGALQPDIPLGAIVLSAISGGIDGLLNFYAERDEVCDTALESAFVEQTGWDVRWARPYFVHSDASLVELFTPETYRGVTLSAPGFYAPQGRVVRLPLAHREYLSRIEHFAHNGLRVTNFEMESSAIAGLSALMGHRAVTLCTIIAQRTAGASEADYSAYVRRMIELALARLTVKK